MDSQTPKWSEFVIPEDQAYAQTDIETWRAAEFLMTKLEPVTLELNPDQECTICQEKFCVDSVSHTPVKIVCGHVFGKYCIIKWLSPLNCWGPGSKVVELLEASRTDTNTRTSCPLCRQVFFPRSLAEPKDFLHHRLAFWDTAYACAGVSLSEKEARSRKHLWDHVRYCHSLDTGRRLDFESSAQSAFMHFTQDLKNQRLTPEQEKLRNKLERIGRKDLSKCAVENGTYVFDIDRNDDEIDIQEETIEWPFSDGGGSSLFPALR